MQSNLVSQGITPRKQAYSKTQLVKAIQTTLGIRPYLNCASGSNAQVIQEARLTPMTPKLTEVTLICTA